MWATPLVGESELDRALWLHNRGLLPKEDGNNYSLNDIVQMAFQRVRPRSILRIDGADE
jgi:hypothetical protein